MAPRTQSTAPVDLPVALPGTEPEFRVVTRGAEPPSDAEVAANPRAASVRVRAAERIDPTGDARRRTAGASRSPRSDRHTQRLQRQRRQDARHRHNQYNRLNRHQQHDRRIDRDEPHDSPSTTTGTDDDRHQHHEGATMTAQRGRPTRPGMTQATPPTRARATATAGRATCPPLAAAARHRRPTPCAGEQPRPHATSRSMGARHSPYPRMLILTTSARCVADRRAARGGGRPRRATRRGAGHGSKCHGIRRRLRVAPPLPVTVARAPFVGDAHRHRGARRGRHPGADDE